MGILWLRRSLVAILGLVLIIDSIVNQFHVLEFGVGLIMTGLLPFDAIIDLAYPRNDEAQVARLREVMKEKQCPSNQKPKDDSSGQGTQT